MARQGINTKGCATPVTVVGPDMYFFPCFLLIESSCLLFSMARRCFLLFHLVVPTSEYFVVRFRARPDTVVTAFLLQEMCSLQ